MTPNSRAGIAVDPASQRSIYVSSAPDSDQSDWIQLSSDIQALDRSQLVIVDGIYAATSNLRVPSLGEIYANIEDDLKAMAGDPDIQHEMQQIAQEFRVTDMDGLSDLL